MKQQLACPQLDFPQIRHEAVAPGDERDLLGGAAESLGIAHVRRAHLQPRFDIAEADARKVEFVHQPLHVAHEPVVHLARLDEGIRGLFVGVGLLLGVLPVADSHRRHQCPRIRHAEHVLEQALVFLHEVQSPRAPVLVPRCLGGVDGVVVGHARLRQLRGRALGTAQLAGKAEIIVSEVAETGLLDARLQARAEIRFGHIHPLGVCRLYMVSCFAA